MSQLLLVSTDLRKTNRSATFRVQKGDYRFECSESELVFELVFGNGDRINVKHKDPISIPESRNFYLELPTADKIVTAVLGDLD